MGKFNFAIDDAWYDKKRKKTAEERSRIVETAANIILQDIRAECYDTKNYKQPTSFLDTSDTDVPRTLRLFLNVLFTTHKKFQNEKNKKKTENKIVTAAHVLINSVRPNSFISPILLGLSLMIHRKYACRALIDCLSNIGLSESYYETQLYLSSILMNPNRTEITGPCFVQFIFDNFDHNARTIDGRNTIHIMGGLQTVTP